MDEDEDTGSGTVNLSPGSFPLSVGASSVSLTRGISNQLRAPRNRITLLSWNLQNFTSDHRMGRTNGAIDSDRNRIRVAFVAAVMRHARANGLMVMETGSDVAQAMEAIRRELGGDQFHPFISERTHETPRIRTRHTLDCGFVLRGDVRALLNLCQVFSIVPLSPRPVSLDAAVTLMGKIRNLYDNPLLMEIGTGKKIGPAIIRFESIARMSAQDDDMLLAEARMLARGWPRDLPALIGMLDDLRFLRLHARAERNNALSFATEALELLHLCEFAANEYASLDETAITRLLRAGPDVTSIQHDRNMPLCLFLLLAHKQLRIEQEEGQIVHELDDARFVYDALQHFKCAEFHYETYGVLLQNGIVNMQRFLSHQHHFSILRFNESGSLLGTQTVGSTYNWRSALRMALPLEGGRWLDVLLFHTRFTMSKEAKNDGTKDTQKTKTYRMRCTGVEEIARLISGEGTFGLPIAFFGDFNLPMTEQHPTLTQFGSNMGNMGFQRLPKGCPATTLCAIPTLTHDTDRVYSQAYDAMYTHGLGDNQAGCRALSLEDLLVMVGDGIFDLFKPTIVLHYEREVTTLRIQLHNQLEVLTSARISNVKHWQHVAAQCTVLANPQQVFEQLRLRVLRFRDVSMRLGSDAGLGDYLIILQQQIATALKVALSRPQVKERGKLDDRMVHMLRRFMDFLGDSAPVLDTLEKQVMVRFAVGYEHLVSDHLPLLAIIDLDRPLPTLSSSGPSVSSTSQALYTPDLSWASQILAPPQNAEDFLLQQGAGNIEIDQYRDFLVQQNLQEGSATSDQNRCLLHTLGQIVYPGRQDGEQQVINDTRAQPGPMLAIGDEPFLSYLQRQNLLVHVWLLGPDGTVRQPPLRVGIEGGRPVHVLHYGAHYVPLWPRG